MRRQGAVGALCVTLLAVAAGASWPDSDNDSNSDGAVGIPSSWWRGGEVELTRPLSDSDSDSDRMPPRWAVRDEANSDASMVYDGDSNRRVYFSQQSQEPGECACTCQHCDITSDSDSDSDSHNHAVMSSDASDGSDDSDPGLSLQRSSDSDGSDGNDGSDSGRRLLQKPQQDDMRALGSDEGSDLSDSERHVDLSSDGSDVSDADPCAVRPMLSARVLSGHTLEAHRPSSAVYEAHHIHHTWEANGHLPETFQHASHTHATPVQAG